MGCEKNIKNERDIIRKEEKPTEERATEIEKKIKELLCGSTGFFIIQFPLAFPSFCLEMCLI